MSAVAQRQADKRSLGFQFKQQLLELVKLIESGKAHYVRCAPCRPPPPSLLARDTRATRVRESWSREPLGAR